MTFRFEPGKPACPVRCKYCFITEHDARREVWNRNPEMGLNRATTFLNIPPWIDEDPIAQHRFTMFPGEILKGDFVGFTAITDPFWPKLDKWLWQFLDLASCYAKIVTCVTKWPLSKETLKRLSQYPRFRLIVSITGNPPPVERVTVDRHLRTLEWALEVGVKAHPICHPYIAGVSDLSFLPRLKQIGYHHMDVKGLRYCDAQMGAWMPETARKHYLGHEDIEHLPEDGWRERVTDAGLTLKTARRWYLEEGHGIGPSLDRSDAEELVRLVCERANIVSSALPQAVWDAAVLRRTAYDLQQVT